MSHKQAEGEFDSYIRNHSFIEEVIIKKILIIDNDVTFAEVLSEHLTNVYDDYQIEVAHNGLEAVEKYKRFLPNILLLDIMLDDCTGYDLCVRAKKCTGSEIPIVILISGLSAEDNLSRADFVGADHYLTKPFDLLELEDIINNI